MSISVTLSKQTTGDSTSNAVKICLLYKFILSYVKKTKEYHSKNLFMLKYGCLLSEVPLDYDRKHCFELRLMSKINVLTLLDKNLDSYSEFLIIEIFIYFSYILYD